MQTKTTAGRPGRSTLRGERHGKPIDARRQVTTIAILPWLSTRWQAAASRSGDPLNYLALLAGDHLLERLAAADERGLAVSMSTSAARGREL